MKYANPVVTGHAPDPSIVRVGDDYYLATSTFDKLPGIVIRHSTDLVTWRIVGHAVTRPAQYRRDGVDGPVELFAPTIRHHDGTFYVVTTNAHPGQGNLLVTATDPAGPWSDAIWLDATAFDPSLFRDDDGTWYYSRRSFEPGRPDGNLGPIVTTTIDVETGVLGEFRAATVSTGGFTTNDIEGPHLFRRGEWYYLTAAEGSSWKGHMQTIGRSRSPWGPFEPAPHNPIITHRDRVGHPIQSLGHADFVEGADGAWWAVALGTRHAPLSQHHNIGRETFLMPVEWTDDGWPVVGDGGTTNLLVEVDRPGPEQALKRDGHADAHEWSSLRRPTPGHVSDAGEAVVDGGRPLSEGRDAGALLLSQTADDQRFDAVLERTAGPAGVAVSTDRRHHATVLVTRTETGRRAEFTVVVDDLLSVTTTDLPDGDETRLSIEARPDAYRFVADGVEVGRVSARLLSAEAAEWFVAAHFALVNVGDAPARFHGLERRTLEPLPPRIVPPFLRD